MTSIAITVMIISMVLVWGGLVVSALALRARSERTSYPDGGADPDGGTDDHREDVAPIEHDT